jgi:signal transduction histidine kinase/DNA-binding response OmpR family regulator/streptogramin lyase
MFSYRLRYFFSVLLVFLIISIGSKATNYHFKHYDINDGLSQNTVLSIFQDKHGFMWFGTKHGLNRFDGNGFETFNFFPNEEVKDNVFRCILEDEKGNIWLGTDEGVYIYNPMREIFKRFAVKTSDGDSIIGVVSDMMIDSDGDIWISVEEKGVFLYHSVINILDHFSVLTPPGGLKGIKLCENKGRGIWVFPYSTPFMYIDKESKKIQEFSLNVSDTIFYNTGEIGSVIADQHNNLLIGTSRQGLLKINLRERTYDHLLSVDEKGQPIFVRDILRKNDDLWIASESGIYIYNLYSREVVNLQHNYSVPYSLSDNAIYSLYEDKEGGIWIGTYFGGVNYYPAHNIPFEIYYPLENENSLKGQRVREFCEAPDGNIWIGTEDKGLNLFNPKTSSFLPVDDKLKLLYHNIHALCSDEDYLWIGTFSKGLNKYNFKTKTIKTYVKTNQTNSLSENSVFSICKDSRNTLWIGTLSGLNTYDYEKDSFTRINELEGVFVQDIFEDNEGNIWIATFVKGLYQFNPHTGTWKNFVHSSDSLSLPYNKITSVFEDSKNRIWITTEGGGFGLFDRKNETFFTYNSSNGLPNDVVYQIKEDNFGNLWLSTNAGLVQFDPEKKSFKNYTVEDGLKTNQFNYKSSYKAPDGTLYFGLIDGFVRFNPAYFKEDSAIPPIVLTDFHLNNSPANVCDKNSPLKESILYTQCIHLPYNKNSFSIKYALLSYSGLHPKNVVYKLEGFDKEWIPANSTQSIIYSNLNPGEYKLIISLETESSSGINKAMKTLDIIVSPPFWKTWWAYAFYIICLISCAFFIIFYFHRRSRKLQLQKMRLFEREKEKELYESKIDFFTNVAHEIRTPLSLIKAPLEQILKNDALPTEVKDNLEVMSKNTDRLLDLTNQLLDFRKTEAELYKLNEKVANVSDVVRKTFERFIPFAKQKNIDFNLKLPEKDIIAKIDVEAFIKIISNLINNAIKYCDSCVNVFLDCSTDENSNDFFDFETENDGPIIPDRFKKEMFKPFTRFDSEKDKIVTGTGIGLALTKSLTELLKGSITYCLRNNLNVFRVIFPIGFLGDDESTEVVEEKDEIPEKTDNGKKGKSKKRPLLLLVEDDLEMRDFLEKCLQIQYNTIVASNGEEALGILKNQNVDLVVSDIMMPKMDGFELTGHIKSDIEFSHIPVILLTAKVNVQSKVQGFEVGADAYVEKPFSVEVLLAQIASLHQNRKKFREAFLKYPFAGMNNIDLNKSDSEFLQKLDEIIQDNIANSDFNIEDLADRFCMSKASFYRKIKGVLDVTPNEYLKIARLKKAAQLLKEGNYRITEICYMVGFNSPSYFAKCFQQQFGVLPKDFS